MILFTSTRQIDGSENIKAVFDAYHGSKDFVQVDPWRHHPAIRSGRYSVMVCDEFPTESPGKIINLLHGFAGGKTSGLDQPHPYHSARNADLQDYVIAPSVDVVNLMARFCGVPKDRVLPLGAPRTDRYIGKLKGDGGTEFAQKKTYFYLPTYRSKEDKPLPHIDWKWLDDRLNDDELLAVRPHPMSGKLLDRSYRHIREYANGGLLTPWLIDCDVVITDYSMAMVDGYLLDKPCVLFEPNEGYTWTRGMYLNYPGDYCSRYARNEEELLDLIRKADGLTETERECARLLAGACDGHSAERVIRLIEEIK